MSSLEHKWGHSAACIWEDTVYPCTNVQDWIAWTQEVIDLPNLLSTNYLCYITHLQNLNNLKIHYPAVKGQWIRQWADWGIIFLQIFSFSLTFFRFHFLTRSAIIYFIVCQQYPENVSRLALQHRKPQSPHICCSSSCKQCLLLYNKSLCNTWHKWCDDSLKTHFISWQVIKTFQRVVQ